MNEKIEQFWRDATADDVALVMKGETVEARFRDQNCGSWVEFKFLGGWRNYHKEYPRFLDQDGVCWVHCQVYDPPAWFLNKPDPGEGYRLLEKFPHESKLPTDEYWSNVCCRWLQIGGSNATPQADRLQVENVWYRRRIANNPVIPDSCRSRDTIPSGWHVLSKDEERLASDAYWSLGAKDWILIGDDRVEYANRDKWYAIRRLGSFDLVVGFNYTLPNGKEIRITEKGFEVV